MNNSCCGSLFPPLSCAWQGIHYSRNYCCAGPPYYVHAHCVWGGEGGSPRGGVRPPRPPRAVRVPSAPGRHARCAFQLGGPVLRETHATLTGSIERTLNALAFCACVWSKRGWRSACRLANSMPPTSEFWNLALWDFWNVGVEEFGKLIIWGFDIWKLFN